MKKITFILVLFSFVSASAQDTIIDWVTVNLKEPVKANSMIGFLDGLKSRPYPDRKEIKKLRPKMFRTPHRYFYNEAYNLSGRVHIITGGEWNEQHNNSYLDSGVECQMYEYETFLDEYFNWGYNRGKIRPGIVWECWNEPDTLKLENFFEIYKRFYHRIRASKLGDSALVAGPSVASFNIKQLTQFFDYCLNQSPPLEVNVIAWHEIEGIVVDFKPFYKLREHVDYIRKNFMENPKYAPLNFKTIEINEIISGNDKNNPVSIASYLGNLEMAGVDYACKSCWPHTVPWLPCELSSCDDVSFNDLFTVGYQADKYSCEPAEPNKTKSAYWVYKLYGDSVPYRVKSESEEPTSIVIASNRTDSADETENYAQVLFGYSTMDTYGDFYGHPQFKAKNGHYRLSINDLDALTGDKYCYAKIYKIPYNGKEDNKELAQPIEEYSRKIKIDKKKRIKIDFYAQKECLYQLKLSANPIP